MKLQDFIDKLYNDTKKFKNKDQALSEIDLVWKKLLGNLGQTRAITDYINKYACEEAHINNYQLIIEYFRAQNINATSNRHEQNNLLMKSFESGDYDTINYLLSRNIILPADKPLLGKYLFLSIQKDLQNDVEQHPGYRKIIKFFHDNNAVFNQAIRQALIEEAVFADNINAIRRMFDIFNLDINRVTYNTLTLLAAAVWFGRPRVAEYALHRGADPNVKIQTGEKIIDHAFHNGKSAICSLLFSSNNEQLQQQIYQGRYLTRYTNIKLDISNQLVVTNLHKILITAIVKQDYELYSHLHNTYYDVIDVNSRINSTTIFLEAVKSNNYSIIRVILAGNPGVPDEVAVQFNLNTLRALFLGSNVESRTYYDQLVHQSLDLKKDNSRLYSLFYAAIDTLSINLCEFLKERYNTQLSNDITFYGNNPLQHALLKNRGGMIGPLVTLGFSLPDTPLVVGNFDYLYEVIKYATHISRICRALNRNEPDSSINLPSELDDRNKRLLATSLLQLSFALEKIERFIIENVIAPGNVICKALQDAMSDYNQSNIDYIWAKYKQVIFDDQVIDPREVIEEAISHHQNVIARELIGKFVGKLKLEEILKKCLEQHNHDIALYVRNYFQDHNAFVAVINSDALYNSIEQYEYSTKKEPQEKSKKIEYKFYTPSMITYIKLDDVLCYPQTLNGIKITITDLWRYPTPQFEQTIELIKSHITDLQAVYKLAFDAVDGDMYQIYDRLRKVYELDIDYVYDGSTVLINAVNEAYDDTTESLIKDHANVDIVDQEGKPAIFYAFKNGDHDIIKLLLEKKASLKVIADEAKFYGVALERYIFIHRNIYKYAQIEHDIYGGSILTSPEDLSTINDFLKNKLKIATEADINIATLQLARLFGTADRAIQYLNIYGKTYPKNTLWDACNFCLPISGFWSPDIWGNLVLGAKSDCYKIILLIRYAVEIEAHINKDRRPYSALVGEYELERNKTPGPGASSELYHKHTIDDLIKHKIKRELQSEAYLDLSEQEQEIVAQEVLNYKKRNDKRLVHQLTLSSELALLSRDNPQLSTIKYSLELLAQHIINNYNLAAMTYEQLKSVAATIIYPVTHNRKETKLAHFSFEYDIKLTQFHECLAVLNNNLTTDLMPDVYIDGATIGYPDFHLFKLKKDDPSGFFLGKLTGCCQSVGGYGHAAAIHGMSSQNACFYVLARKHHGSNTDVKPEAVYLEGREIVAQTFALASRDNNVIFNSVEFHECHNRLMVKRFFEAAAKAIVTAHKMNGQAVEKVTLGITEKVVFWTNRLIKSDILLEPVDYNGYRNSTEQQLILTTRHIENYKHKSPSNIVTQAAIFYHHCDKFLFSHDDKRLYNICLYLLKADPYKEAKAAKDQEAISGFYQTLTLKDKIKDTKLYKLFGACAEKIILHIPYMYLCTLHIILYTLLFQDSALAKSLYNVFNHTFDLVRDCGTLVYKNIEELVGINHKSYPPKPSIEETMLLHRACLRGDIKRVKMLIDSGEKVGIKNAKGQTALDIAMKQDNVELVGILHEAYEKEWMQELDSVDFNENIRTVETTVHRYYINRYSRALVQSTPALPYDNHSTNNTNQLHYLEIFTPLLAIGLFSKFLLGRMVPRWMEDFVSLVKSKLTGGVAENNEHNGANTMEVPSRADDVQNNNSFVNVVTSQRSRQSQAQR